MRHGGMHALKDIVQHEIFTENCANVPIFSIRLRLRKINYSFCCSTGPSVQFGVSDDPCT